MYRAVAWRRASRAGIPLDAGDRVPRASRRDSAIDVSDGGRRDRRPRRDRSAIRTPEIDMAAAAVARIADVRAALVARQRALGQGGGVVMEGRDIGTVVFPGRRRQGLPRRLARRAGAAARRRPGAHRRRRRGPRRRGHGRARQVRLHPQRLAADRRPPTPSTSTPPACRSNPWSRRWSGWCATRRGSGSGLGTRDGVTPEPVTRPACTSAISLLVP